MEKIEQNDENTAYELTNKLMIIGQTPNKEGVELYDIQNDPGEIKNLANVYPQIVKKVQAQLRQWQESVFNSLKEADYKK